MRPFLLLSACCLLPLAAHAAIITERNDVYNGKGCYAPSQYTFIGSASFPGIDSCWIPYGTYTGGTGSVEYLRVTSNLMGVVASALGGFSERQQVLGGYDNTMMRPAVLPQGQGGGGWWSYYDHGELLESTTNRSLRIADQLNLPLVKMYINDSTNYHYYTDSSYGSIEPELLRVALDNYGSRRLEAIVQANGHSIEPPISSEWSATLPYNANDAELWRYVYPMFCYCTNDLHFLQRDALPWRAMPNPFNDSWAYEVWGSEQHGLYDKYCELQESLTNSFLDVDIEDILSYDTGWKYEVPPVETASVWRVAGQTLRWYVDGEYWQSDDDERFYIQLSYDFSIEGWYFSIYDREAEGFIYDETLYAPGDSDILDFPQIGGYGPYTATRTRYYADTDDYVHWTNGTSRLDWKRLGIICQLERQMDTTYQPYSYTDELPLWVMSTAHDYSAKSTPVEIQFPEASYSGQTMDPVSGLLRGLDFSKLNESYRSSTNITEWSTPTCRTPAPSLFPGAHFLSNDGVTIWLNDETATNMLDFLVHELHRYTTNKIVRARFSGEWLAGTGMTLEFLSQYSKGVEIVTVPSNTVEVSTSDGFSASSSRESPIAQSEWYFGSSNSNLTFRPNSPSSGSAELEYVASGLTRSLNLRYSKSAAFNFESDGSVTMPPTTFTAVGGGPVTNWLWRMDGIETFDESWCIRTVTSEGVTWHFNATGVDIYYNNSGSYKFVAGDTFADGGYSILYESTGEIPSSWTAPSITATWHPDTCEVEVENTDYGTLDEYPIPVVYDNTNGVYEIIAELEKTTHPTFTFASEDTRIDTISRFPEPYSWMDWSRVYSLRRSELELLLCARGDYAQAESTLPSRDSGFTWNAIRSYGGQRLFRMLQGSGTYSLQDANATRYDLVANLSIACKTKCEDLGGMPIGSISTVGKITDEERGKFLSEVKKGKVSAVFSIAGRPEFSIEGEYSDGYGWAVTYIGFKDPKTLPVQVGWCGWNCEIEYDTEAAVQTYNDARVDGYQAPVRKTIWKFKNLRDPNF